MCLPRLMWDGTVSKMKKSPLISGWNQRSSLGMEDFAVWYMFPKGNACKCRCWSKFWLHDWCQPLPWHLCWDKGESQEVKWYFPSLIITQQASPACLVIKKNQVSREAAMQFLIQKCILPHGQEIHCVLILFLRWMVLWVNFFHSNSTL